MVHICEIIFCKLNLCVDENLKYLIEKDGLTVRYVFFNREFGTLFCRFWIVWPFLSFTVREVMNEYADLKVSKGKEGRKYPGHAEIVLLQYRNVTIRNEYV